VIGFIVTTAIELTLNIITTKKAQPEFAKLKRSNPELSPIIDRIMSFSRSYRMAQGATASVTALITQIERTIREHEQWIASSQRHNDSLENIKTIENALKRANTSQKPALRTQLRNAKTNESRLRQVNDRNSERFYDSLVTTITSGIIIVNSISTVKQVSQVFRRF